MNEIESLVQIYDVISRGDGSIVVLAGQKWQDDGSKAVVAGQKLQQWHLRFLREREGINGANL